MIDLVPSVVLASTPLHQARAQIEEEILRLLTAYCLLRTADCLLRGTYCSLLTNYYFTRHLLSSTLLAYQVHTQFSLLSIDHAYVTSSGRLLGVIRRAQLVALQSRE